MKIYDNEGGGKTVLVRPGDELSAVPRSHRRLVTEEIRKVFVDPIRHYDRIAKRTPFPRMAEWLQRLVESGQWELELFSGRPSENRHAVFALSAPGLRKTSIGLPEAEIPNWLSDSFPSLSEFYGLVSWMHLGWGNDMIWSSQGLHILRAYQFDFRGDSVDPDRTIVWGNAEEHDFLIADADDRAGWFEIGFGEVRMLGTIANMIDLLFAELLTGRRPSMDAMSRRLR